MVRVWEANLGDRRILIQVKLLASKTEYIRHKERSLKMQFLYVLFMVMAVSILGLRSLQFLFIEFSHSVP